MAGGTFPNSGLRWNDPGEADWVTDENYNIDRLNDTLLKLTGLLDVNGTEDHGSAAVYNGSTYDMRTVPHMHYDHTTTTTSTTTTTTTT